MGGKRTASPTPGGVAAGPRGPSVAGPSTGAAAGSAIPLLARILGPKQAAADSAFEQERAMTSDIVGNVAGGIMNFFFPGSGGIASAVSNRIVREQYNTFGGRPFFESANEPLEDWPSILIGTVAGGAGSLLGGAAGGAASGGDVAAQAGYTSADAATGAADVGAGVGGLTSAGTQIGAEIGGRIGARAGGYAGQQVKRALYGDTGRRSQYKYDPYQRRYVYGGV